MLCSGGAGIVRVSGSVGRTITRAKCGTTRRKSTGIGCGHINGGRGSCHGHQGVYVHVGGHVHGGYYPRGTLVGGYPTSFCPHQRYCTVVYCCIYLPQFSQKYKHLY